MTAAHARCHACWQLVPYCTCAPDRAEAVPAVPPKAAQVDGPTLYPAFVYIGHVPLESAGDEPAAEPVGFLDPVTEAQKIVYEAGER